MVATQPLGGEVGFVEGLQGVVCQDVVSHRRSTGAVDRIEQFAQRNCGRFGGARVLPVAGVGDDQFVGGGGDGVEEELAVLGAQIAFPGHGVSCQHVVTVDAGDPRKHRVVQADQAHHAMRNRTHRCHGAHGQGAGSEV